MCKVKRGGRGSGPTAATTAVGPLPLPPLFTGSCVNVQKNMPKSKFVEKSSGHPILAVDVVIFAIDEDKLKVVLIKMLKAHFEKKWAVPGGRVRVQESVDEAARRSLAEQAGIKDIFLEQLYTFGRVDRDPFGRVVSVAYFALVPSKDQVLATDKRYGGIEWFDTGDLPSLAYDHAEILKLAIERLRAKLEYTNIVCNLLPDEFRMSQLQKTYEIILGRPLDKRNFQKKILSLGLVKKTDKKTSGMQSRPAALFRFVDKKPRLIEIL